MAKRISDEEIKLSIIIDGNPAQKELLELDKSVRDLNARQKELRAEKAKLEKQGKKESDRYREVTREIKANSTAINENKAKMKTLQDQIGITGLTMKQLGDKATHLRMVLRNMIPGSADYKRYEAELKAVSARLDELKGKGQAAGFSIGALADRFNRYAALGASVIAAGTGVVLSLQKIIDYNGKLSESITDVQKTTGMSKKEVEELAKSFGLLKTRTGRIELLGIAEVGGKLGIAKEEIGDFVRIMNKSAVALGDAFEGGPEQVAEKLGRIKGLYEELKNMGVEEAFERVGSAINELGAAGTASEPNLAEFTTRVGAIPEAFRPSIQTVLGMGAAFEESGLKAEVAGNNYAKVISIASREIDKFAMVMKRPQAEMEALINSDPNEFFLQFSNSLKGLKATELSQVLDYLKLNDNEVKMVLGAASANVDLFREKIALATTSMAEATSLTDEYNLKNSNLAATLDRIKKTVTGWFSSDGFVAFLTAAVNGFARLIGATDDADDSTQKWRNTLVFIAKAIAVVTAAMVTSTAWMKLTALWTARNTEATLLYNLGLKARAVIEGAQIVVTQAWAAAQMLLRGNIIGATQALRVMAATMMTTPWGLILGFTAAVVTAYIAFSDSADKAARQQKMFNDIAKEAAGSIRQEVDQLKLKAKMAADVTKSDSERKKILEELIAMSPEHLKGLTLQNIATDEGRKILDGYIKSLEKSARAKAVAAKLTELYTQMLDIEKSSIEDNVRWYDHLWNAIKSGGNVHLMAMENAKTGVKKRAEAIAEIEESIQLLLKEQAAGYKPGTNSVTTTATTTTTDIYIPDSEADKARKAAAEKAKKAHEDRMMDLEKQIAELRELERQGIDDKLGLLQDGFEKEISLKNETHRRKIEDLQRRLISEKDILAADQKINDPNSSIQDKDFWTKQKEVWLEKNRHINNLIRIEEQIHYNKLGAIVEKEAERQVKLTEDKYSREKVLRETAFLQELNAIDSLGEAKAAIGGFISQKELNSITTLEEAKKVLKEKYQKEELEAELKFLEEKITKLQEQTQSVPFMGVDLNLLTPEQREKIQKDVELAQLAAEKVKEALNSIEEGKPEEGFIANDLGLGGQTDILGFTPEQWDGFFENLDKGVLGIQEMMFAVQSLTNVWSQYGAFVEANENARLKSFEASTDKKRRRLKWQLDNGYISQTQYNRQLEALDSELDRKKADIEYKQAKRQKQLAVMNVLVNTAQAIMSIWAQVPKFDFGVSAGILSGIVGGLGALQLATILKTPLPAKGYEEGLYQDVVREQDGKVFKSRYGGKTKSGVVHRPTHFLTGENGPEMIIDAKAYRTMPPAVKDSLLRHIRGVKGFEQGYYNNEARGGSRIEVPAGNGGASSGSREDLFIAALNRNSEIMERIHETGLVAYFNKDFRDLKKLQDDLDRLNQSRNKAEQ